MPIVCVYCSYFTVKGRDNDEVWIYCFSVPLEAASLAMNFLFASCWRVQDAALLQSWISSASWKQYINCPCSVGVCCCSAFLCPAGVERGWMISVYKTWFRLQWKLPQALCWGLCESSCLHFSLKHFKPKKKKKLNFSSLALCAHPPRLAGLDCPCAVGLSSEPCSSFSRFSTLVLCGD